MHLIDVFLPLDRGDGSEVRPEEIEDLVHDFTHRFGGATAFTRAPAEGLWHTGETVARDRIVIIEVMVEELDETWWAELRKRLEDEFIQEKVLIRATECRTL
ncbi:hypothetical protein KEU06_02140 [Pseudaminobacter sp. 19-2017]|uniref:Uncharacterized protein n=1 Tax=Pseudaminobacter soli (ex Zhang et al. 2022) TaxID=2831468 RepID=A0A942DXW1_9HYPH|nr:hypothetical protein [Pseudaminobacter soli]MBS3647423.1 hypothetical protein [Pseudaminobacter soli]